MGRKVATLKRGPRRFLKPVGNPADPDGLVVSMNRYLDSLKVKGQTEQTLWNVERYLRDFIGWCDTRALERPQEITKPILETYQRYLFYYRKRNGAPLSFASQRGKLTPVKGLFKWLTKHNYLLSNPASELELPRMVRRLPKHVLTVEEVDVVMSQPDLADPLRHPRSCRVGNVVLDWHASHGDRESGSDRPRPRARHSADPPGARAARIASSRLASVRPPARASSHPQPPQGGFGRACEHNAQVIMRSPLNAALRAALNAGSPAIARIMCAMFDARAASEDARCRERRSAALFDARPPATRRTFAHNRCSLPLRSFAPVLVALLPALRILSLACVHAREEKSSVRAKHRRRRLSRPLQPGAPRAIP